MSERTGLIAKLRAQRDHADDWRTTLAEDAADRLERDGARIAELEIEINRTEYERHTTALERDHLRAELAMANDAAAKGEVGRALGTALEEASTALEEANRENDWLRAYTGQSAKACVYCGLGADEQGQCERGFPGCARADDQMLCREVGVALERDALRAENEALRKDAETLQRVEKRIEELWDTVAPVSYDDPGSYRRGRTIGTADTLDAIRDAIYAAKERTP